MWQRTLFLQISPLLLAFFFFFIWCMHFVQPAMLFVIAICRPVRESKMLLCISPTFFFIHSLTVLLLLLLLLLLHLPSSARGVHVCTHGWGILWLWKQMCNDSTRRGPSNWAREARVSLPSTCVGYSSPIHFASFFFFFFFLPDLSITNSASCRNGVTGGPCERSSEIDRQVRELIVVQDTSAGAQRYSSYTSPASPPLHHPASLRGALPHSFASKLLFLRYSRSWKAGVARRNSSAASERFSPPPRRVLVWPGKTTPFGHQQHQTEEGFPASSSTRFQLPYSILGFSCSWQILGEIARITGQ